MALKDVFDAAGQSRRFVVGSYSSREWNRLPTIEASADTCSFMMRCAENAGDLMDAARDHSSTVASLREHEELVERIRKICGGNSPNALAHIAIAVTEFCASNGT